MMIIGVNIILQIQILGKDLNQTKWFQRTSTSQQLGQPESVQFHTLCQLGSCQMTNRKQQPKPKVSKNNQTGSHCHLKLGSGHTQNKSTEPPTETESPTEPLTKGSGVSCRSS